jgi:type II secretory pathway component PulF
MPDFHYSALNPQGQSVTGVIRAETRHHAIAALAERREFVVDISDAPAGDAAGSAKTGDASLRGWWTRISQRKVSLRAKAAMLAQLATAQEAGLPLLQALRVVEQQSDNPGLASLLADLASRVQGGESLSGAMRAHAELFTTLEVSMVRVGETAGVLDQVMIYLADFAERDLDMREKIRSASLYPLIVLILAAASFVIILMFILPKILASVADSVAVLPWPTRIMMGMSSALWHWGWLMAIVLGFAVWGFRRWLASPDGRLKFDTFRLRLPVVGDALRRIAVARFARTLGTLSKSGIQILEALHVLRDTLGNEALARKIDHVATSITQGQSIAEPLRETGEFPPLLIQVIALGERTGRLDELLLRAAMTYEKETTTAVQRLMAILPVVLTIVLAVIVLFVLMSVLLPIMMMNTGAGGL